MKIPSNAITRPTVSGILSRQGREGPIATVAAQQRLINPDHRERLEQPGPVQRPGVKRLGKPRSASRMPTVRLASS